MSDELRRELISFLVEETTSFNAPGDADALLQRYVMSPRDELNSQCQAVTVYSRKQCSNHASVEYDGVGLCGNHANLYEAGRPVRWVGGDRL